MAKVYKGSLSLEWHNKQKAILTQEQALSLPSDSTAPLVDWVNREESLFYEIVDDQGKGNRPYWVDRNDIRIKEARPLVLKSVFKAVEKDKPGTLKGMDTAYEVVESFTDDEDVENILIKGDNLLALNTLRKHFDTKSDEEKVKCVYIDPPYNTKSAFVNYDDNLAHSEWLSLMRDRLSVLYHILADDGVIFVSIDDKEFAYLKILLDEIFGRDNFIATFIWKTDGNFDNQARIKVCHEYVLMYAKDESRFEDPSVKDPNIPSDSKLFNELIQNTIVKNGPKNPASELRLPAGFPANFEEGVIAAREDKWPIYKSKLEIKGSKLKSDAVAYSGWSSKALVEEFIETGFKPVFDQKGQETVFFLTKTGAIEAAKKRSDKSGYVISVLENMGSTQKMSAELKTVNIKFDFPKPEGLISYLLKVCTEENDLVLDCFGGSGTTFAVAHKLKRRWIGVELGSQADKLIVPRLKHVIAGTDDIGITQGEKWKGGGAFKYYHLGPSIISRDQNGKEDFNWSLGSKFIEESMLLSYDYVLSSQMSLDADQLFDAKQNTPTIGIQQLGSKRRVAIVSINDPNRASVIMPYEEISFLYNAVKKTYAPEYVNIFTNRGVEMAYDSKPDDLEIIKVPHAIFAELEK